MKRFWREVSVHGAGPFGVTLDGRAVRTPAKAMLELPSRALADAVAGEWAAVEGTVKPGAMPMTGLANAAIDLISVDLAGHAARLAAYAGSDLVSYRADAPEGLVARQAAAWDPIVEWARAHFGVPFVVTAGLMPVAQPAEAVERVAAALAELDAFGIAACAQLVPISGSALLVLAMLAGEMDAHAAFSAASVDEAWSEEHWGQDDEATAMLAKRAEAFGAAHRFLVLARAGG
jgi:chaperone required for assembly of F1-ATPase